MFVKSNSKFLAASVSEFVMLWASGAEASLNLTTCKGLASVAFNCSLGHPEAPLLFICFNYPPSTSSSSSPRASRDSAKQRTCCPSPGIQIVYCCSSNHCLPFTRSHRSSNTIGIYPHCFSELYIRVLFQYYSSRYFFNFSDSINYSI